MVDLPPFARGGTIEMGEVNPEGLGQFGGETKGKPSDAEDQRDKDEPVIHVTGMLASRQEKSMPSRRRNRGVQPGKHGGGDSVRVRVVACIRWLRG